MLILIFIYINIFQYFIFISLSCVLQVHPNWPSRTIRSCYGWPKSQGFFYPNYHKVILIGQDAINAQISPYSSIHVMLQLLKTLQFVCVCFIWNKMEEKNYFSHFILSTVYAQLMHSFYIYVNKWKGDIIYDIICTEKRKWNDIKTCRIKMVKSLGDLRQFFFFFILVLSISETNSVGI